ncbi:fungal Zn(2)-Cys(6) binuclear cluster domain containing protein [Acanthamoeba castellanii str. Neff]|uniref:Fungal Zn(2)-Cys(6) binuclear cluster domain containing protein n=1 Tax=Acanthamoeba castellanii (strain ATCC 30010 / Neff) TaxID=1257118 RepID=L8H0I2_ACACF|nr:fungal Zn(2)-Cys(6) binuclear cluster domain containing protein [Acanthamoeba castellanii str. Neff]ELR18722.1 fungal Zn(2)-Cys(6) binuclear cluster domain containing protein [Acanthamoeba castellanii str. Neff]
MDTEPLRHSAAAGPKACATCRLAHVSCDREQPCARCVRVGKAESCQPSPTRKRGRPRKTPAPDNQELQQDPGNSAATAASKRLCVRPKTTDPVVDLPGDGQPPHAAPAPAAGPHCSSSPSLSSSSSSSLSPPAAEEGWASSWSYPSSSSPSQPAGFAPRALPAPAAGQGKQEQDWQGLRSLLMLVREMRCENEHLHDTIAQLRATQKKTERRLARMEQDNEIKSRQLKQTHIELEQTRVELHQLRMELNKKIDDHVMAAHPCPPPRSDSQAAVAEPTMPGADVERFIAQTLPFLRAFDWSSLIIRDLRRPFLVMRMEEAETLDDMDTPIIAYASPSMCNLLGYDTREMYGFPISSFGVADPESIQTYVRTRLMRSPTPVGEPFFVSCTFITKEGRGVLALSEHQLLCSQRRLVDWHIMQVERVLATDLGLVVPLIKPTYSVGHDDPRKRVCSIVHEPSIRAYLLARLPHSLLFGRRGELTTTAPQPHPHYSFGNHHHHRSGTAEQQRPPTPSGLDVTTHELRAEGNNYNNDDELEELGWKRRALTTVRSVDELR